MKKGKTLLRIFTFCVAFFVDCLKLFFEWGFLGLGAAVESLTPIGGGVAGAAAGCYLNAAHSLDIIGCFFGALGGGVIGAAVSFFGVPLGWILGQISTYCVGVLGGIFVVGLLFFSGSFNYRIVFGGLLANLLPGIDMIPFEWTIVTFGCLMLARSKEGGLVGDIAKVGAVATMLAQGNITGVAQTGASALAAPVRNTMSHEQQSIATAAQRPARVQLQDIRPASKPATAHA